MAAFKKIFKKIIKSAIFAAFAFPLLYIALNIGIIAVNDIGAAAAKSELVKEAKANDLTVISSECRVGHFFGNGNGAEYLSVVFLSEVPKEEDFEGCDIYLPDKYKEKCGYYISPPQDYKCAVIKLTSPGNYLLYDFDLRGH